MKKLLLLLCILPILCYSQFPYSTVNPEKDHNFLSLASSDGLIAAVGWAGTCRVPYIQLHHNASGSPLFESTYSTSRYGWYTDVCGMEEEFWAAGKMVAADDVWSEPTSIMAGYNQIAQLLFNHEVEDDWAWQGEPSVHPLPGGGVIWNTGSKLYQVSEEGSLTDSLILEAPVEYLGVLTDSTYILKPQDTESADIINETGAVIHNLYTGAEIIAVANSESYAYLLTEDLIIGIDLVTLSTEEYPLEPEHMFNRLAMDGNKALLYTVGAGHSVMAVYSMEDGAYDEVGEWDVPGRKLNQMIVEEFSEYYLVGTDYFSGSASSSSGLHNGFLQYFLSPAEVAFGSDIGVASIDLAFDTAFISHNETLDLYYFVVRAALQLEVHNYGVFPFEGTFVLGSNRIDGINCVDERYYEFHTENINAGESVVYEFMASDIQVYGGAPPSEYNYNTEISRCFFTGAPDRQLDAYPANNRFCASINVSGVISDTENIEQKNSDIHVYPNPVKKQLFVERSEILVDKIEVLDMHGNSINCPIKEDLGNTSLDFGQLSAGVYILVVTTPQGIIVKRILKQ